MTVSTGVAIDSFGNIFLSGGTTGSLDGNRLSGKVDQLIIKYADSPKFDFTFFKQILQKQELIGLTY
ncbi:hypothetical protein EBS43_11795 [bacterium]|nr:hypothetical protein [bacterium]